MIAQPATRHWIEPSLYPFESHYLQLQAGRMHYVDEGEGDVILFVHGTPTWSFLYRDFIKALAKDYRCIAVDHLGFGLSESPDTFSGAPEHHAANLSEFISRLDLRNITLVVHDFGGPIGLAAGIRLADRIERVVIFNTWLWETKSNEGAQKIDRLVSGWLGKFLYLYFNVSPRTLLPKGFADRDNLSKVVHRHYLQPFPDRKSRKPLLQLARALVGSSDWYQEQWEQLDQLQDKEWLILWGNKDEFITTEYLEKWRRRVPNATVTTFDCGHFVQEERSAIAIAEMRNFLETIYTGGK